MTKHMRQHVPLLFNWLFLSVCCSPAEPQDATTFRGPYLGQEAPGTTPERFVPGYFPSSSKVHGRITFSPDGRVLYWAANAAPVQSRWYMVQSGNGVWTEPQPSWLSLEYSENGLSFSQDGNRAYFHSRRSSPGGGPAGDMNIWYRELREGRWSDPIGLGPPVNGPSTGEYQPTVTADGTLYFMREGETGGHGPEGHGRNSQSDIYMSLAIAGEFSEPTKLGTGVNSEFHELEPAVAPDHSYLVFSSNRPGGFSSMMNLYVSFRTEVGAWSPAVSLSEIFQLDDIWFPSISPDGRYLFFCDAHYGQDGIVGDYFWVDVQVIEELRPGY